MRKIGVIIPAGGAGSRMGAAVPKQFMMLGGEPVMAHSIRAFHKVFPGAYIVVAMHPDHFGTWERLREEFKIPPHKVCEGGPTRCDSVRNAIAALDPGCDYIAVHDAARPLVSESLIAHSMNTARRHGSAIPVLEIADSIRRLTASGSYPADRSEFRAVQTPQVFRADILRTAYERAAEGNFTDDASVVESTGYSVMLCTGERRNIKITHPADLAVAEAILKNDRQ